MERWAGKVAVVTGSSTGIGLAISIALVREGMIVVGFARRKVLMEEAVNAAIKGAKGKFYGHECDVTSEKNVIETFQTIKKKFNTVHVLVNNAGTAIAGTILDTNSDDWQKIFDVNVMGLLYCTKEAMKLMKESRVEGHIVNINSIEGHRVHMYDDIQLNVYPASKHAVTAISETLRKENLGGSIKCTSISPGYVKTSLAGANDSSNTIDSMPGLEAEDIANAVVYVVSAPPRVQIEEIIIRPLGEKTW